MGGRDTVVSTVSTTLRAGQEIEVLRAAHDKSLALTGNAFDQEIVGRAGKDFLDGKGGNDTLTGGARADTFIFSTALGSDNIDRITDYSATDDTIQLSKAIFTALSAGSLDPTAFKNLSVPGASVDADDRILYDQTTGALSYDADGNGSKVAVQFAVLDNKAALTAADFLVV